YLPPTAIPEGTNDVPRSLLQATWESLTSPVPPGLTAMWAPLVPLTEMRRPPARTGVGTHSRACPRTVHSRLPVRGSYPSIFSEPLRTSSKRSPMGTSCGEDHESHTSGRSDFQRLAPVFRSRAITYDAP